jgi:hypothetical protein
MESPHLQISSRFKVQSSKFKAAWRAAVFAADAGGPFFPLSSGKNRLSKK